MKRSLTSVLVALALGCGGMLSLCRAADPAAPPAPPAAKPAPPAQKAPAQPPAKPKADAEKNAQPEYYKLFSAEFLPSLQELEKRNKDLVTMWSEVDAMQQQLRKAERAFGTKARKETGKDVPRLTRDLQKRRELYDQRYQMVYQTYKNQYEKLKGEEMDLGDRLDADNPDNPNNKKVQARIDDIGKETVRLDGYLEALSTMRKRIVDHEKPFSEAALFGVDGIKFDAVKAKYPEVLEARRVVQDRLVDLEALKKAPPAGSDVKPATPADIAAGQEALDGAVKALADTVAKRRKPLDRETETMQKNIDRLQERIDSARKRGKNSDKETKERDDLGKQLEALSDEGKLLDTIGKLVPPAAK